MDIFEEMERDMNEFFDKMTQTINKLKEKESIAEMCYIGRISMGLSQKDFAKLIGSTQTEISFIEKGFVPLSIKKIDKIKKLYFSLSKRGV